MEKEIKTKLKEKTGNKNAAELVGQDLAKKADKIGIKNVFFDRGGYLYHGRVKVFAEAVRKNGLKV